MSFQRCKTTYFEKSWTFGRMKVKYHREISRHTHRANFIFNRIYEIPCRNCRLKVMQINNISKMFKAKYLNFPEFYSMHI